MYKRQANLSVFGYDPKKWYTGRSPLEAVSMGIELSDTDVAYRCNFVTLSEAPSIEDAVMEDYSAGEITTEEARELVDFLNVRFHTARTHLFPGITYRHCLCLLYTSQGNLTGCKQVAFVVTAAQVDTGQRQKLQHHRRRHGDRNQDVYKRQGH